MASTYSPSLRAELIGSGDQSGTWGSTTNNNFQYIFEAAIAGYQTVAIAPTSNNQVLTYTNGPTSTGSADQSVYAVLKLNASAVSANFNLFAPPASKQYVIWNNTSYTATFYNSSVIGNTTAAGSGVTVPVGAKLQIWSDGTNFFPGFDTTAGNLTVSGNLAVSGTTTLTGASTLTGVATFTANPVMSGLTASSAVATDASKNLVSVTNTGTGSNVLAVSPTLTGTPLAPTATAGTNTTQIATTAFVAANAVLTGALLMWPTAAAPTGYLICDGTAVSRTTYATLFAVVGTTFGVGDGSTTFNIPNYTNRMPYGTTIGATGGSVDAVIPSHTHTASTATNTTGISVSTYGPYGGGGNPGGSLNTAYPGGQTYASVVTDPGHNHAVTVNSTGVSPTNANLPPYLGINFIIKT